MAIDKPRQMIGLKYEGGVPSFYSTVLLSVISDAYLDEIFMKSRETVALWWQLLVADPGQQ